MHSNTHEDDLDPRRRSRTGRRRDWASMSRTVAMPGFRTLLALLVARLTRVR